MATIMAEPTTEPVLLAFTADHVARVTGLSLRQLRYWSDTRFFAPKIAATERGRPYGRIYSFRDLVGLRTIAILRKAHRVPLQELRRVGAWLSRMHATPWSSLRFFIAGRRVFFQDPSSGRTLDTKPFGQVVLQLDLQRIADDVESAARRLRDRQPDQIGRVERHRYVVHNANVVAGTRIPTEAVWNLRDAGYSDAAIIREYPRLKPEDVRAALAFEESRRRKRTG